MSCLIQVLNLGLGKKWPMRGERRSQERSTMEKGKIHLEGISNGGEKQEWWNLPCCPVDHGVKGTKDQGDLNNIYEQDIVVYVGVPLTQHRLLNDNKHVSKPLIIYEIMNKQYWAFFSPLYVFLLVKSFFFTFSTNHCSCPIDLPTPGWNGVARVDGRDWLHLVVFKSYQYIYKTEKSCLNQLKSDY